MTKAALTLRDVPVKRIDPNPWNPNQMTDDMRRAARESIEQFGFVEPITVRRHPDKRGRFQIINGEHRWEEARGLGLTDIPAIVLDHVTDAEAKKLTVLLNEIKGKPDTPKLAKLIAEIRREPDFEKGLPYKPEQIDHLLHLAAVDFEKMRPPERPKPPGAGDKWFFIAVRAPEEFRQVWENVLTVARANDVRHRDQSIEAGMVLEMLAADFLAGPRS